MDAYDDMAGRPLWAMPGELDDETGEPKVVPAVLQVTVLLGEDGEVGTAIDLPSVPDEAIRKLPLADRLRVKRAALKALGMAVMDLAEEIQRLMDLEAEIEK